MNSDICGAKELIVCATIAKGEKVLLVRHDDVEKGDYGTQLLPAGSTESTKPWRTYYVVRFGRRLA